MLFSGITFLYYFIPCVMIVYFVVPKCFKNASLLLASIIFYAWGEPKFLVFMVLSVIQGYIFGLLIEKFRNSKWPKVFLATSVLFSLGLLGYCKYADFFIENINRVTGQNIPLLNIALPIGISFYTFQIMSYVIDVYKNQAKAQRNFINLATYITMFPQLVAGPIVRYTDIEKQLKQREHSFDGVALGIRRFVAGLSKKILLANTLGELVDFIKTTENPSLLFFGMYAIAYTLHIYFDFSGYSDMAIGLGKIFGFHFPENFDYPYISRSITEFWRRWHISLGSWFRDYVYIPLGGNRVGKTRWFVNIFIVWMATGFWHGAAWNFILWGVLFAVLLIIEKKWLLEKLKKQKLWNHLYVLFFVIISFVIFDGESVEGAFYYLKGMFGFGAVPLISEEALYYLRSYGVLLLGGMVFATPGPKILLQKLTKGKYKEKADKILIFAEPLVMLGALIICTAFLVDGSFNPFLYFRF